MAHRTQGDAYICWFIIKNMIKDTDEQLDEEVHRARSGRVPCSGSVLVGLGCITPTHVDVFTSPETL